MAEPLHQIDPGAARARILELLRQDGLFFPDDKRIGMMVNFGKIYGEPASEERITDHIISLLEDSGIALRSALQSDPPEMAWQMTDPHHLFIKLVIRERRFGEERVYAKSIHESVHPR